MGEGRERVLQNSIIQIPLALDGRGWGEGVAK
jgi:hypothetical protein